MPGVDSVPDETLMTAETQVIEVTLESSMKSVETAAEIVHRLCQYLRLGEDEENQIDMAVHESVINAVLHGNKNDSSKSVWLRFEADPSRIEIRVRDQGAGFDPDQIPSPLEAANLLRVSGRGIFLIRTFMDEFNVLNLHGQGTEVVMVKRMAPNNVDQGGKDRES